MYVVILLLSVDFLTISSAYSKKAYHKQAKIQLRDLGTINMNQVYRMILITRGPSGLAPSEDYILDPPPLKTWADSLFMEDSEGVMSGMRATIKDWQDKQEYISNWNIEKTGTVTVPDSKSQQNYVRQKALNYLDKRVSGEVRNPKPGTTWVTVAKVNRTLKPTSEIDLAPQYRLHFSARVLQGKASMNLENPYVGARVEGKVNGQAFAFLNKDIVALGLQAQVEYRLKQKELLTTVNKKITDTVSAKATSVQRSSATTDPQSDQKVEINFGQAF